jgi:hydroxyacylglutathione hydrolase
MTLRWDNDNNLASLMMLRIDALPAFDDNYLWLLQDERQRRCSVVDPGDAAPVLGWLDAHPDWRLEDILVTHHHADHVCGVELLKHRTGARVLGPASENIPGRDVAVRDGQRVESLGLSFDVLEVPGHTLGHVAYFHPDTSSHPLLFCGDTLFAAGCGRLFEGTADQMYTSLQRLAALPERTAVFCAHEYTLSNLRFAQAAEPTNTELAARLDEVGRWRAEGRISLPSDLGLEQRTNPFLRCDQPALRRAAEQRAGRTGLSPVEVFAQLRAWKDVFR